MEFRVLGSLEAVGDDGPIALGGAKQRAVLAHLLLRANSNPALPAIAGEQRPRRFLEAFAVGLAPFARVRLP